MDKQSELNHTNEVFWQSVWAEIRPRLDDSEMINLAMEDLRSETARQVPLKSQKSFEQSVLEKKAYHKKISRKGGRAVKTDALQKLIVKLVRKRPDIGGTAQLLRTLRSLVGKGVITRVESLRDTVADESPLIHYLQPDKEEKSSPVKGLKDRLYRAKISASR